MGFFCPQKNEKSLLLWDSDKIVLTKNILYLDFKQLSLIEHFMNLNIKDAIVAFCFHFLG